jgi:hypothetical protein
MCKPFLFCGRARAVLFIAILYENFFWAAFPAIRSNLLSRWLHLYRDLAGFTLLSGPQAVQVIKVITTMFFIASDAMA